MKVIAKIMRLGDIQTRQGRLGEYQTQGVMLQMGGDEERQSLFGTLFGQNIDVMRATGLRAGDMVETDLVFTTSERNGFVSNYVELRNVRKA